MPLTGNAINAADRTHKLRLFIVPSLTTKIIFNRMTFKKGRYSSPCDLCFSRRSRAGCGDSSTSATKTHDIIAQSFDLLILFAAENVVRSAGIERRHFRAGLNFLRILQPLDNPLRTQTLARKRQIGRPTFFGTLRLLVALLMAAKAIEIIFGYQFLRGLHILRRNFGVVEMGVRVLDFGKAIEESHQAMILLVRKTEGRHSQLEPWANRKRRFQKTEQPLSLHLLSLTVEHRRRQSRTLLIIFSNEAAPAFDFMTTDAVVLVHEPASFDHLKGPGAIVCHIAEWNLAVAEAGEHNPERLDIFISQVELRHDLLNPLGRVGSRCLEFVVRPVVPRFFYVGVIAEEQLFERLAAKSGELDADARFFFHSRNVVATKATVLADQRFAARDVFGILQPPVEIRDRFRFISQGREITCDRQGLLITQPQARHSGIGVICLGILDPVINPLRADLAGDILEIGNHLFRLPKHSRKFTLGEAMTALAANRLSQFLAPIDQALVALLEAR